MYTHNVEFKIGSGFIECEAEFNTDGEASYKMGNMSEPLQDYVLDYFTELTDLLKKITADPKIGEIKKIEINKKE